MNPNTRHEVVARVQRLGMLNGSLIGRAERRDAEIRYLRRALDEAGGSAGAADAAVTTRHPRIAQLLVRAAPCVSRPLSRALTCAPGRIKLGTWRPAEAALLRLLAARALRMTC